MRDSMTGSKLVSKMHATDFRSQQSSGFKTKYTAGTSVSKVEES